MNISIAGSIGGNSNIAKSNPTIIRNATITPINASPAINPAVSRRPVLIIFSFGLTSVCLIASSQSLNSSSSALPYFFYMYLFVTYLTIPPKNIWMLRVNGR